MAGQSGGQRLCLSTLNEQLICKLCGGYFIDATTIIECLHSFCKSCIVKHLENHKYCPVCDGQVHKNKPLLNIRPDKILQDIVYKLVPGCYQNEMRCRKEFYSKHPEEKCNVKSPEALGEPVESYIYSPDESLSLSLEYYSPGVVEEKENDKEEDHLPRRYLRCPAAVTVFHLQKLIRAKYGLSEAHRVDIMYKEEPLHANYTLIDIMYIYHWRRKVPLHLSYRIFESASKRLKMSEDNDEFKQSLSNNNMEIESKEDEQSLKREWKEVQLKISETGVMSVTDISNLDTKKSTKGKEINPQNSLDEASKNVNKPITKVEDKESTKSKIKKVQQENSTKKSEKPLESKASAMLTPQSDLKNEAIEIKSIDQRDISSELVKNEKSDSKISKSTNDSSSAKGQVQSVQEKIKTEPLTMSDKRLETKQHLQNKNNMTNSDIKTEGALKQNIKPAVAGSKINALSAKLQFQPKVGQVNNTYSKKLPNTDRKAISSSPIKISDVKFAKTNLKDFKETKDELIPALNESKTSVTTPIPPYSQSNVTNTPASTAYVTTPPGSTDVDYTPAPSTESLASIGLHVSTTMSSQVNLNNWLSERNSKASSDKDLTADQQLRSIPGIPQLGKEIVCSTTAATSNSMVAPRFSIQTPSMSIYSITTSLKNNVYTSSANNYTNSPSKQSTSKFNFDASNMYPIPPCPDAIPISQMKQGKQAAKGSMVNEICAKISSGSKINDICAKIGENSKEKNKIVPDLLKISKKNPSTTNESLSSSMKHIPNIPNVPIYTPSSSQALQINDNAKKLAIATSQAIISAQMQKMTSQKKPSQAVGYKTTRDPPKSWNPTLSKNYVAAKNQAKELQNQSQAAYGISDGSSVSKQQIPSKPAKIFKIRNMPRYLGNPASGVKPMYGTSLDQPKEKEQSNASSKNNPSMSMMKIDPQTLSPIVSSPNSPILSPPPYSTTTARSYQNSHFSRDIRNSTGSSGSSPMSPRNSPVNMLSTNPFIPSHTPNTNPRLIYSPFPPGFADAAGRFSANPLIRSPIGLPQASPSAFHSSLPPSIKLYQRNNPGYMAQPQSNVGQFPTPTSVASIAQPPTVQRVPPSGHSSSSSSSPSSKTSPKSKSPSTSITPSISSVSLVDTVALQLAAVKSHAAKHNLNAFDLTRNENSKSNVEMSMKPSDSVLKSGELQKTNTEKLNKENTVSSEQKSLEAEAKLKSPAVISKEGDKKEKSLAKLNGGVTDIISTKDKIKEADETIQQQSNKIEKLVEGNNKVIDKTSTFKNTPVVKQETDKIENNSQSQQKYEASDLEKTTQVQAAKSNSETQQIKTES